MPNVIYVLEKIKIEDELHDIFTKTNAENVTVLYKGSNVTLTAALAGILADMAALPTGDNVDSKISAAIDTLIGGAPATYDTLKEIADYISSHEDVVTALNAAIGNKVDKAEGKGLSAEDFTTALKTKLDNMPAITAEDVAAWNAKADSTEATQNKAGLMSAADKTRLDNMRGVRYGAEAPADMQDGELFVHVVSE